MTIATASTAAAELREALQSVPVGPSGPIGWADETAQVGKQWSPVIDTLRAWRESPEELGDDFVEAPSHETLELALQIAESLSEKGLSPPLRVVPTVDGGIAFEHRIGDDLEIVEIDADGTVEFMVFRSSRLIERNPWDVDTILSA